MKKMSKKMTAVMLAVMIAATPFGSVSFAAEDEAAAEAVAVQEEKPAPKEESKKEEVKKEEPKKEVPVEEKASAATLEAEEASAPAKNNQIEQQAQENSAVQSEEKAQTKEAAQPAEEPKPAKSSYKVTIVLDGVMTASGESTVTAATATVSAKGSKTYSATTVNGWIKTKSVHYDGVTYKYASALKDADGNTVTSIKINGADLTDDTTFVYTPVYTEVADMKVTINFKNIMKANGEIISDTETNTLSAGSGWSFTQKKLDNKVVAKSFNYQGVRYEYTGTWVNEADGSEFTSLKVENTGETAEIIYNIHPVYNRIVTKVLDYRYIDRISTGSGSWKNVDEFTTMTHTFKEPEAQKHYRFVEWKDFENEKTFVNGDKDTYKYADLTQDLTEVKIYAMWQPSVTVQYYSNDEMIKEIEKFDGSISAYGYEEAIDDADFIGWFDGNGEDAARVAEGTEYELPGVTYEPVEQKIIKLYAKYTADYSVEYYQENPSGEYELVDEENIEGVEYGAKVKAEIKDFEGFSLNEEAEGTLIEAKAAKGLTLKLYYDRNSYEVSYEYDGEVPEDAAKLPAKASYKFGQDVEKAEAPANVHGFIFNGWEGEVEKMPARNVIVKGIWSEIEKVDINTEYYMENLNGEYELAADETETIEQIYLGDDVKAEIKEFKGFTLNEEAEGTLIEAKAEKGLTLKLYYDRNNEEDDKVIPENADNTDDTDNNNNDPSGSKNNTAKVKSTIAENTAAPAAGAIETAGLTDSAVPMTVADNETPMAPVSSWALINLLCAIATAILSLILMAGLLGRREEEDEESAEKTEIKRRAAARIFSLIPAVGAIVAFIITEDMSNPIVLTDNWTILMAAILLVQVATAVISKKDKEEEECETV